MPLKIMLFPAKVSGMKVPEGESFDKKSIAPCGEAALDKHL